MGYAFGKESKWDIIARKNLITLWCVFSVIVTFSLCVCNYDLLFRGARGMRRLCLGKNHPYSRTDEENVPPVETLAPGAEADDVLADVQTNRDPENS